MNEPIQTTINLTPMFQAAWTLILLVISWFVIPWLKEKRAQIQDERIKKAVDEGCKWAQQKLKDASGATKRQKVLEFANDWLQKRGYNIDPDLLNTYLEASVYDINSTAGGIVVNTTVTADTETKTEVTYEDDGK